ncbi:hypothetical protein [Nocardia suismassiliense]|uniref:hypothetical protein n=1 Tax=Nocardia suismassiliense TaxID=2077092 RepID=UPI000D1F4E60|nr:hypothetical protein [Nocardia suismassiliense]
MNRSHTTHFTAVVVTAFAVPMAAAGLLACTSDTPVDPQPPAITATSAVPTALRWQPFQGVNLPVAEQGPRHIDGAVATGFDRNPVGAALAAIHATVRMSIASDSQWPSVGARMLAPGPARDLWATTRAQISITAPIADGAPKLLGYRLSHYSGDAADIDVYSIHPDNSLTRNSTRVIWHVDDWRLRPPEDRTRSPVSAVDLPPADMVALPAR